MVEMEQRILADAYHRNDPKAFMWILGVVIIVLLIAWFKRSK